MSRFYTINLTDSSGNPVRQYTSTKTGLVSGEWMPGALNVELDLPVSFFLTPIQRGLVRIHGIALKDISQAADFTGLQCQVFGGMGAGLPLAKPSQAGLLTDGEIRMSYANWVGTDQALDLILAPSSGGQYNPVNLSFVWLAGQTLGNAISTTLQIAFPNFKAPIVNCAPGLVRDDNQFGAYESVEQLSAAVNKISLSLLNTPGYSGVQITFRDNQWIVFDSTASSATPGGNTMDTPTAIDFLDLIGQPTWFQPGKIQFACPIRSDLRAGDFIKLPAGPVTTLEQSLPQGRSKTAFAGVFQVDLVRHIGNYRQADASSWLTTVSCSTRDPNYNITPSL